MAPPNNESSRLLQVKRAICDWFTAENWHELGLLTDCSEVVSGDGRLLRALSFGDDDYGERVAVVLKRIAKADDLNLEKIEQYVASAHEEAGTGASPLDVMIVRPKVFRRPEQSQEPDLVAVMMPFAGFDKVHAAIKAACEEAGLRCERSDDEDIWNDPVILQDIFELIHRATVVVCDLSGKNANVYYETGLAHALGRDVVPIAQSMYEVPSDFIHHRVLKYHPNTEGLQKLTVSLGKKLRKLVPS